MYLVRLSKQSNAQNYNQHICHYVGVDRNPTLFLRQAWRTPFRDLAVKAAKHWRKQGYHASVIHEEES